MKTNQKLNKKKVIIVSIVAITIISILIIGYITNENVRSFFDRYILRKEVNEDKLAAISINADETNYIYAYNKYITVLNKNKLTTYNASGKKEYEQDVLINNPIYNSENRFLVIGEKGGKKIYLISEENIVWQNEIEGEIKKVNVNKNGYVTVIISGTSYKTIVATYSPTGKELFKTYLSNTIAIDADISNDNKYLAIGEINTSGTLIQSNVKIISIEKAQTDPTNSVVHTYNIDTNNLLVSIEYSDKSKLLCMYDTGIAVLEDEKLEDVVQFKESKVSLASIKLNNYMVYTLEKSIGPFTTSTQVILKNSQTKKENIYTLKNTIKSIYTNSNKIALNIGTEVHFINTNGWLIRKYVSSQEIKDIVISDQISGIVYKDKIEIVNL